MRNPILLVLIALLAMPLLACSTAPPSDRAFSRDWANEHRRVKSDRERRANERLFVFGQEVRTPEWLDTDDRGRPELRVGETPNSATAVSVDRGELGLRHRWGGSRNRLPAPPGYDNRGNPASPAQE